jgi:uncharacterized protein (DUF2267 family)
MVVLGSNATALEAARALENNEIGAVLVREHGRVAGIVTDRDLAVRVLGRGLDPKATSLGDVMTKSVCTLEPSNSVSEAIHVMEQRNVRRVPLVEADRIVGMVTLDDLLVDERAPLDELASVVQAQIGAGGPAASARSRSQKRRVARAEGTYNRLLNRVRDAAELDTPELADTAFEVVLSSLVRRLTPGEAKDLAAQLPSLLAPVIAAQPPGPDKSVTRETIEADLVRRLDLDPGRAGRILTAIGSVIVDSVSAGQMDDVRRQLPQDLRAVFSVSPSTS